ncbi:hypothetical protein [Variovorax sp. LjRoot178]|uniref:hypothetical protein n=1 Tax=Variovorax sp. LjRoot178 TaxID=3342277 RepID=UPI003ED080DD
MQILLPIIIAVYASSPTVVAQPNGTAPLPSVPTIRSCSIEPARVAEIAAKRGYVSAANSFQGEPTCSVNNAGTILVVSATASADALCKFVLFTPPDKTRQTIQRIAIKAGAGGVVKYFQRAGEHNLGINLELEAKKGDTRQFRIISIDVDPVNGQCLPADIEGAM